MRRCRHRVVRVCTQSVGVVSHRVTPCAHTKTKTETLDRDLRPEEIAKAEIVTNVAWLGREEAPGPTVSVQSPFTRLLALRVRLVAIGERRLDWE